MDYIAKIRKNKRRYLGFKQPKTKYQQRKESTILDFLFYMKKNRRIDRLNKFREFHILDYLKFLKQEKALADATILEKAKILQSFYRRNQLGQG